MTSKVGSSRKSAATTTTTKKTNLNKSTTSASSIKQLEHNENTASSHVFFQNDSILEDPQDAKDKLIIAEYVHLLDKSRQLFNSLRFVHKFLKIS